MRNNDHADMSNQINATLIDKETFTCSHVFVRYPFYSSQSTYSYYIHGSVSLPRTKFHTVLIWKLFRHLIAVFTFHFNSSRTVSMICKR